MIPLKMWGYTMRRYAMFNLVQSCTDLSMLPTLSTHLRISSHSTTPQSHQSKINQTTRASYECLSISKNHEKNEQDIVPPKEQHFNIKM